MSERFGPNFAPGSFALQQSIRWPTRSELYPDVETAQPGQQGTTRMHTHRKSTHTLGNGDTTQQPARESGGELVAAAAAAVLLLLLRDPRCIAEHNPSQQTVSRFVFFGTHAEASNGTAAAAAATTTAAAAAVATAAAAAQQQQQQIQQQGRPKQMYAYTTRHQAG